MTGWPIFDMKTNCVGSIIQADPSSGTSHSSASTHHISPETDYFEEKFGGFEPLTLG